MKIIKKWIKRLFISVAYLGYPKIVIASTGRAGSTMLFDAVADSLIKHRFHLSRHGRIWGLIKRLSVNYVDRIDTLPKEACLICKTHDTYSNPPRSNSRFVFVYGDPLESAMSVEKVVESEGREWFGLHQYHLKASGAYEQLYSQDVLNYEGQLISWLSEIKNENVFCVDYDDLWDEREELSRFIGFDIDLPERRQRKVKAPSAAINQAVFCRLRELKKKLKREYQSSIHEHKELA